ncbi:30S ribosomal protein S20 [bacterium]|nr:30S ribosomal protein S20 [candidate division CSSED10-310 bacterium]
MAHHQSAEKRIRQNKVLNMRNKARRTRVRNAVKAVRAALENKDLAAAQTAFQSMVPIVDKMATLGILHQNEAARTKSRLNKQIRLLSQKAE